MSPAVRSFPKDVVESVFAGVGIYLLETFPDGQLRWGNRPPTRPYRAKSIMTAPYRGLAGVTGDHYDIFMIGAVIHRLGFSDQAKNIMESIEKAALEASEKEG
jgi:hypothetical protein